MEYRSRQDQKSTSQRQHVMRKPSYRYLFKLTEYKISTIFLKLSTIQSQPVSDSFIDFEMIKGEWQKEEDICIQIIAIIKRQRCYNECGAEDEDKNLYVNGPNE
uniref:Uncharacterized protein n=1 Tax=Glossina palpalis gambiensis TaxID=67801 RepID=A0A1B0BIX9_9MUSC